MPQGRSQVLWVQGEEWGGAKNKEKKQTSKLSNTYTNKVDKKASTPYLLKKKKNDKVVAIKVNKQANNGAKRIWVPKEIISNIKSTKEGLDPEREVRSPMDFGEFGDLAKYGCILWGASLWTKVIAKWVSEYYGPKFSFPC